MSQNTEPQLEELHITAREQSGSIETNFFKYAMRFLQKTDDIDKSLDSLLALLANLFNVDNVAVCRVREDECDVLYQWVIPGAVPITGRVCNGVIAHIRRHFVTNKYGGMFSCADVDELPMETATQLRRLRMVSGICVRIDDFSHYGNRYYLVCGCCTATHQWSESEKRTICMAASIVGVYLNLKAAQRENEINRQRIQNIFDALDSYVYIVDVDTKEILYINEAIRSNLGSQSIGKICYKTFCGRQAPCENCVADMAEYKRVVKQRHLNRQVNAEMESKARLIDWDKDRKTAIIISDRILT